MPSSLTTVLAVLVAALDPILEAARAQQDKEHVIDFFAAARARELKQLRASEAVEREQEAAAANATAARLMGELKDASGKFWKEHSSRLNAEKALRDHAASLRDAEAKQEHEAEALAETEQKLGASRDEAKTAEDKVAALEKERESVRREAADAEKALTGQRSDIAALREKYARSSREAAKAAADVKKLEEEVALLRAAFANSTKEGAVHLAAAKREAARAIAEATRARGALAKDQELLDQVEAAATQKVSGLQEEWKKEKAQTEAQTEAQIAKEEETLQKLDQDRTSLQQVAEAAVKKSRRCR